MPALFERTQVGKREDLADYITLVDAKDTPVTSMIPKGNKPGNTLLQFQADNMPTAVSTGSVDGVDVSSYENLNSGRAVLTNYVQVFQRAIRVSPLSVDVSIVAGLRDELAGMVAKGIKTLKRDMELTVCSDNAAQVDNGTDPYLTKALGVWIANAAGTVAPIPTAYLTPSTSINTTATASFAETDAQAVLTSIYGQTGQMKTYDTVVGPTLKRAFSNLLYTATASGTNAYAAIRTLQRDAFSDTISSSVDLFEGDFGSLRLHPTLFNANASRGYVLDMDLLELRYTNLPQVTELPDAGGGPARLIKAVAGLVCKNPLGLGKFSASS
ncbi:Family of unknown function (DUF5309) [uncultured Caudovirales phage]|uniref:Uncharacterized protein n=1 Tax=uncultured Caudovirales phage TaxID=2100421 RepID=A0A6J7X3E9_9CAUD|nr:Family of unknown function (DUF5309) [uncultured Caudovirales phage]